MRRIIGLLAALSLATHPLVAQELGDEVGRTQLLRQRIEDRFAAKVQEDLALNDDQASRMRGTVGAFFAKRRALEGDERRLRAGLAGQLRPGVAANQDSVARYMDQLIDLKIRYVETYRDEVKEMSAYLTPVQRAQFFLLRERLLDRVREAQDARDSGAVEQRPRRVMRP